jgi:hypothetical protein
MTPGRGPFDAQALQAALDAQRQAQGLSWAALGRRLGISPSTMQGLGARSAIEADGALRMIHWLGRSPESFAGGVGPPLPAQGPGRFVRTDVVGLHSAVEAACRERGLNWADVAAAVSRAGMPTSAAMLTRLAGGGRTDIDRLVILAVWIGRPAADFVRWTER